MEGKRADFFNLIQPLIKRLLTGLVMFIIANNGFLFFTDNEHTIIKLVEDLRKPLITDVKFVDWFEDCPDKYTEIRSTEIPGKNPGCLCDWELKLKDSCTNTKLNAGIGSCVGKDPTPKITCNANCCSCFDFIEEESLSKVFSLFYDQKNICYYKDESQTTITYLKSFKTKCSNENVCNDYFCRVNDVASNKCPITNSLVNNYSTDEIATEQPFEKPLLFANNYIDLKDYDNDGYPNIYLPFFDMHIGNNFMCDSQEKVLWSNYSLINRVICLESIRYDSIDTKTLDELIRINNYVKYYNNEFPMWEKFMRQDNIRLQTEHILNKNLLNCIIKNKNAYLSNRNKAIPDEQKEVNKESVSNYIEALIEFSATYDFVKNTLRLLVWLQSIVIFLSITAVLLKLFNCCYDYVKPVFFFYNYENFLSLFFDFVILIVSAHSSEKLLVSKDLFDNLSTDPDMVDCLGEYGQAKIVSFSVICDTIQGGHFNLALIAAIRFIMIFLSLVHYFCTTKMAKYKMGEVITILLEKENTQHNIEANYEDDEEEEENEVEEENENEEEEGKKLN